MRALTAVAWLMSKTSDWVFARIAELTPKTALDRPDRTTNALISALIFFEGRNSMIFGMICDVSTLDHTTELRAACEAALRDWYEALASSDPSAQAMLYRSLTATGLFTDLAIPALVSAEQALIHERDECLDRLPTPAASLAQHSIAAAEIERLSNAKRWFGKLSDLPRLPTRHRLSDFLYVVMPSWHQISGLYLPPDFLPIADAGSGDYLGILLDGALVRQGITPVVLYFHENGPTYTWMFESASVAQHAVDALVDGHPWSESLRGHMDAEVEKVLEELNDSDDTVSSSPARAASRRWHIETDSAFDDPATIEAYRNDGNLFAVTHLEAQMIWIDFATRIAALKAK
jgi:hypothetical protein